MKGRTLKFGVIGAGYLGRHHARIYRALAGEAGGIELAAVCDTDAGRAREVAGTYGARVFTDYREVLPLVDAVSIVTPTSAHHEIAMACLMAGKDILVEKPVCQDMAQAREIAGLAREKGLILQAGHIERFNPAAAKALQMVEGPLFIEAHRESPFPERSHDVDVTLDVMIHDIDLVLSAFGCPAVRDVKAAGARIITQNIDIAQAWVDFENGSSAYFSASRVAAGKRRLMQFVGKDKVIKADLLGRKVSFKTRDVEDEVEAGSEEPLKEELADFARCVKERTAPRVSPSGALSALELALRISQVIRSGW